MTVNWKHVAHDVAVVGGLVESVLSIAGTLGPSLPAADVVIVSVATAGVAAAVAVAEDVAAGNDPTSSVGKFIAFVIGIFQHQPKPAVPKPVEPPPVAPPG